MSLRQTLNNNPGIMIGIVIVVVLAAGYVLYSQFGRSSGVVAQGSVYYTADDGKTFFADKADKIPPFDYNGQEAVRAYVVQCGTDQPYVAYMTKYKPKVKEVMEQVRVDPAKVAPKDRSILATAGASGQVRKQPGEKDWKPFNAMARDAGPVANCPDGTAPKAVQP